MASVASSRPGQFKKIRKDVVIVTNKHHWVLAALGAVASVGFNVAAQTPSTPAYTVTRTVALGAPDRWDYVTFDPDSHRAYVAHGDRVTVVDGRDGTVLGEIAGLPGGTHGIAIASAAGHGYTDDGKAGEAASFDLHTFKVEKRIKAAEDADAVTFDRKSGHVFVINGDTGSLTVIDPKSNAAVATIDLGGKLEDAVSGENGKLYVNGAGKSEIVRVDTKSNQVDAHWAVPDCERPHGLAIDTATHRLFSSCVNSVMVVVNADTGAMVAKLPIGRGTDAAAFDPKRKYAFSSNGVDGTLSIIEEKDAQTFVSLGDLKTTVTARTMALDPESGRIYLVAADLEAPTSNAAAGARRAIVPGSVKLLFLDPPK
jgi:YVTN family beta-propeller protein